MRLALLAIPAVRSALSLEIGRDIEYHAAVASTQERARALAAAGSGPAVVVADHQTAGQGTRGDPGRSRRGRAFSVPGSSAPLPPNPAFSRSWPESLWPAPSRGLGWGTPP